MAPLVRACGACSPASQLDSTDDSSWLVRKPYLTGLEKVCSSSAKWKYFSLDTAAAVGRAHFLSSAGQLVSKVMEVDLVWSAVWTTKCFPSGLTS